MTFRCACGREISELVCRGCRAAYDVRPGWRSVRCACGSAVVAGPGLTSAACASCFARVEVAVDAPPAPPLLKAPPRRSTSPPPRAGIRDRLRWLFPLTLLPLVAYTFTDRPEPPLRETVKRAVEENPRFMEKRNAIQDFDDLFRALEIEKLEGAYQSRFSMTHWIFAIAAAGGFWALILGLFPIGRAISLQLWTVGLLIGTAGILLLLGLHRLPFVKALYDAATGDTSFITSFMGYTLGIGLCEELVKLLPLVIVLRKGVDLDVRGAVAWGLAMGAGFGVSEAIFYSGELYNGLLPGDIYLVRFVSCVGLHMTWSATAAAWLWGYRDDLEDADNPAGFLLPVFLAASGPVVLHGLYDVLLKFGANFGALCAGSLTFTYFFWSVDRKLAAERAAATAS